MSTPIIVFVCWGNICRSPMAERVAKQWFADQNQDALITSAGVSAEESGNPMDRRAKQVLENAGYEAAGHRAHQITADEILAADLVIAAEPTHLDRLRRLAPQAGNLHLLSEYDPNATPGQSLPDPWYGGPEDFMDTLDAIELAMPGVIEAARTAQSRPH